MTPRNFSLAASALILSASASAEVLSSLANLSNVKPATPTSILITDAGKEGLFIPTGNTDGKADNAVTIKDGNNIIYKRHITGALNATWWGLNTASSDNYAALNNAITYAPHGSEIYIPAGRYKFKQPVILPEDKYLTIKSNGILEFDNSHGIISRGRKNLELYVIESHGYDYSDNYANFDNSGIVVEDATNSEIKVYAVRGFANGIHLTATGTQSGVPIVKFGTQYNRITFNNIHAKVGVFLTTGKVSSLPDLIDGAEPWVNENTITGGSIRGEIGLLSTRGAYQTDGFNGNKFYNFGFEKVNVAFDLEYARNNLLMAPRFEQAWPMKFDNRSRGNVLIVTDMRHEALATNAGSQTIIIGTIMDANGSTTGVIEASTPTNPTLPPSVLRPILKHPVQ